MAAFDFATNDGAPPVTAESLSELDMPRIINNPKLRHDVNFDRELHFRPNLDGLQGAQGLQASTLYWQTLKDEMKELQKPLLGQRSYRVIKLPNALEVLIPDTDRRSTDMDVDLGSSRDNVFNMPGVAAAAEDLLFPNTEKYSGENDYSTYLDKFGGHLDTFGASKSAEFHSGPSASQSITLTHDPVNLHKNISARDDSATQHQRKSAYARLAVSFSDDDDPFMLRRFSSRHNRKTHNRKLLHLENTLKRMEQELDIPDKEVRPDIACRALPKTIKPKRRFLPYSKDVHKSHQHNPIAALTTCAEGAEDWLIVDADLSSACEPSFPEEVRTDAGENEKLSNHATFQEDLERRWILNLSMHFRDESNREKFFVTYADDQSRWRRLTVSLDYGNAPEGSLEAELSTLSSQREKSFRIYEVIRDSLPEIQYYETVTNLNFETDSDGRLHVHVHEDADNISQYPALRSTNPIYGHRHSESELQFGPGGNRIQCFHSSLQAPDVISQLSARAADVSIARERIEILDREPASSKVYGGHACNTLMFGILRALGLTSRTHGTFYRSLAYLFLFLPGHVAAQPSDHRTIDAVRSEIAGAWDWILLFAPYAIALGAIINVCRIARLPLKAFREPIYDQEGDADWGHNPDQRREVVGWKFKQPVYARILGLVPAGGIWFIQHYYQGHPEDPYSAMPIVAWTWCLFWSSQVVTEFRILRSYSNAYLTANVICIGLAYASLCLIATVYGGPTDSARDHLLNALGFLPLCSSALACVIYTVLALASRLKQSQYAETGVLPRYQRSDATASGSRAHAGLASSWRGNARAAGPPFQVQLLLQPQPVYEMAGGGVLPGVHDVRPAHRLAVFPRWLRAMMSGRNG